MALTLIEAAKLSRDPLTQGVFLAIATSDQMISQLPMVQKSGKAWMYNREKTLPTAAFVAPDHTSLAESSATFDEVTVPLRLLIDDVDTYIFAEEQQNDTNSQRSIQLGQKLKAVGRTIADKMINGSYASGVTASPGMAGVVYDSAGPNQDTVRFGPGELFYDQGGATLAYRAPGDRTFGPAQSEVGDPTLTLVSDNPNKTLTITVTTASLPAGDATDSLTITTSSEEPDGLKLLVSAGQTTASVGANGDALSFATLDQVIDDVKTDNNKFLCMNSQLRRKYYELVRSLGGTDPVHVTLPGINGPVPTYRGHPILRNDNILSDEAKGTLTDGSSVYCLDFHAEQGFYAGTGGGSITAALTPRDARIMGVRVREIGELEGKEATRTRVSWYGAFGLGSELAVARASEIITA